MGDEGAPFLLGSLLVIAIVKEGRGEGTGNRPKDEPVARGKLEFYVRKTYTTQT